MQHTHMSISQFVSVSTALMDCWSGCRGSFVIIDWFWLRGEETKVFNRLNSVKSSCSLEGISSLYTTCAWWVTARGSETPSGPLVICGPSLILKGNKVSICILMRHQWLRPLCAEFWPFLNTISSVASVRQNTTSTICHSVSPLRSLQTCPVNAGSRLLSGGIVCGAERSDRSLCIAADQDLD